MRQRFALASMTAVGIFLLVLVYFVSESFGIRAGQGETDSFLMSEQPSAEETETEPETTAAVQPVQTEPVYVDLTPPVGKAKELVTWWDEEKLLPEEFVESMQDDTKITVSFERAPDMELFDREQEVAVCLTDEGGNRTVLVSKLILKHDGEAPEMTGVYNMTVFAGDMILYRKNVQVTDNHDENPKLTIDSSEVNRNEVGTYHVTYRAEDKAGNVTEKEIFVKVMEKIAVTQAMVDDLADKVLSEILTDGMSNRDKAYAIYQWTKKNIAYTGHTDPSDIVAGAYQGLRYRAGDCFTFCAVAHMLYTRAGFEAMKVTRTAGYLHHYWNYVNFGEGWYHCDSNLYRPDGFEAFMKTTDELITYTTNAMNRPDYYVYDESQYPPCAGSSAPPEGETESTPETGSEPGAEGEPAESGEPGAGEQPEEPEAGIPEAGGEPGEAGAPEAEGEPGEAGVPEAGGEPGAQVAPEVGNEPGAQMAPEIAG